MENFKNFRTAYKGAPLKEKILFWFWAITVGFPLVIVVVCIFVSLLVLIK